VDQAGESGVDEHGLHHLRALQIDVAKLGAREIDVDELRALQLVGVSNRMRER
jgi:hypothetical protein